MFYICQGFLSTFTLILFLQIYFPSLLFKRLLKYTDFMKFLIVRKVFFKEVK